jgi:hypothetical protein
MKSTITIAATIWLALSAMPAVAKKSSTPRTDQVRGVYEVPKEAKFKAIYDTIRERRLLETLRRFLSPLKLPRRLTLKVAECDGEANAFYEEDTVTVCYEYLDYIVQSATQAAARGATLPTNPLIGPTVDVFLHEVGHAVFDMLEVPVFGREEDAADQFSAYIMLQFAPVDAQRLIRAVAFLGATEAREAQQKAPELKAFADAHGLPAQRYFNVICMAYGFDPKGYADAITTGRLTEDRAEGCTDEYAMLERAFRKLIRPHLDQKLLRKVRRTVRFQWEAPKLRLAPPDGAASRQ